MQTRFIEELEKQCGGNWPALRAARVKTDAQVQEVRRELSRLETPQTSVVVTGSFGRGEVTSGSDFDWMLLVDGGSDPEHVTLANGIFEALEKLNVKQPGRTQTFGELVSSHDLVHYIAGTKDTNENLTRRVLLLLESIDDHQRDPSGKSDPQHPGAIRDPRSFDSEQLRQAASNPAFLAKRRRALLAHDGVGFRIEDVGKAAGGMGDPEHQASVLEEAALYSRAADLFRR